MGHLVFSNGAVKKCSVEKCSELREILKKDWLISTQHDNTVKVSLKKSLHTQKDQKEMLQNAGRALRDVFSFQFSLHCSVLLSVSLL